MVDDSVRLVGLGCMRLSVTAHRDREAAIGCIVAAVNHGVNLLDTAPSYGLGEWDEHHNERLIRDALACTDDATRVRISTKVGLVREGAAWVPDGRAKAIRQSCERSLEALDRPCVDYVLLHTVDPRTDLAVSLRALRELKEQGLAREIGVSNANLAQLTFARGEAPITAVQIAWSHKDDKALRGGVIAECRRRGVLLMVHSPFAGPKRAPRLGAKDARLASLAAAKETTPHGLLLAFLYGIDGVVPLPGATRLETAIAAGRARDVTLDEDERSVVADALGLSDPLRATSARGAVDGGAASRGEVVLVTGIQGAGKTRFTADLVARGHERLNRDERGGSLEALAKALDARLAAGAGAVVLDNTYVTRAQRNRVIEVAHKHGRRARCIHLDTPLEVAQTRVIRRLFDFFPTLPSPETLRAASKKNPQVFGPTAQHRMVRALEVPSEEEGFDSVEIITTPLELGRALAADAEADAFRAPALAILADGLDEAALARWIARVEPEHVLVYAWALEEDASRVEGELARLEREGVDVALCPHGGGPPVCWCRPPLPGLLVGWAVRRGVELGRAVVIGSGAAHKKMARAVGARFCGP